MKRIVIALVVVLAGCDSYRSHAPSWLGGEAGASATAGTGSVYYSGVAELRVFESPSTSSKVVGSLSLHQKVVRSKIDRGFAFIESTDGHLRGWVNNAQLIWKVPAPTSPPTDSRKTAPAASAPSVAEPATEPVPPTAPEPASDRPAEPTGNETAEPVEAEPAAAEGQDEQPTPVRRPPARKQAGDQGDNGGVAPSVLDAY